LEQGPNQRTVKIFNIISWQMLIWVNYYLKMGYSFL
jgi:hypothetical protein